MRPAGQPLSQHWVWVTTRSSRRAQLSRRPEGDLAWAASWSDAGRPLQIAENGLSQPGGLWGLSLCFGPHPEGLWLLLAGLEQQTGCQEPKPGPLSATPVPSPLSSVTREPVGTWLGKTAHG